MPPLPGAQQLADGRRRVGGLGHGGDDRDAVDAGGEQVRDVGRGHAADGDDRHVDRCRDGADRRHAERPRQAVLRRGRRGRPDAEVGRALRDELAGEAGVAGGAAEDVVRSGDPPRRRHRQVVRAEVGAAGADGQRDVDPVVDEAQRTGVVAQAGDPVGELEQRAVGAALRPHLHDRRARGQGRRDDRERVPAVRVSVRTCRRPRPGRRLMRPLAGCAGRRAARRPR
jgi:hypothetical protein